MSLDNLSPPSLNFFIYKTWTGVVPTLQVIVWIKWDKEPGRLQGVAKSWTRLSNFTFTFHFHALLKEMATHSSVLAWRIPGTGKPGGLPSMGSHGVGHDWSDLAAEAAAAYLGCAWTGYPCQEYWLPLSVMQQKVISYSILFSLSCLSLVADYRMIRHMNHDS